MLLEHLTIDVSYCGCGDLEVLIGFLGDVNVTLEQVGYLLLLVLQLVRRLVVSHDHYHAGSL